MAASVTEVGEKSIWDDFQHGGPYVPPKKINPFDALFALSVRNSHISEGPDGAEARGFVDGLVQDMLPEELTQANQGPDILRLSEGKLRDFVGQYRSVYKGIFAGAEDMLPALPTTEQIIQAIRNITDAQRVLVGEMTDVILVLTPSLPIDEFEKCLGREDEGRLRLGNWGEFKDGSKLNHRRDWETEYPVGYTNDDFRRHLDEGVAGDPKWSAHLVNAAQRFHRFCVEKNDYLHLRGFDVIREHGGTIPDARTVALLCEIEKGRGHEISHRIFVKDPKGQRSMRRAGVYIINQSRLSYNQWTGESFPTRECVGNYTECYTVNPKDNSYSYVAEDSTSWTDGSGFRVNGFCEAVELQLGGE